MSTSPIKRAAMPLGGDACPCGSEIPYASCHRQLRRRINTQIAGEAVYNWNLNVDAASVKGLADLLEPFYWAFKVRNNGTELRLTARSQWPPLIECVVVATGSVRYADILRHFSEDVENRMAHALANTAASQQLGLPAAFDQTRILIDEMDSTRLDLDSPRDWIRFAGICVDWCGRVVPGEVATIWQRMIDWYLSYMPFGVIQGIRVDQRRHDLRKLINFMTQLPHVAPGSTVSYGDLFNAGRSPMLPGWGLAVPMIFDYQHVAGFAAVYQFNGFIFCLPETHKLGNISRDMQYLFSVTDQWASGHRYRGFHPHRVPLTVAQHRRFLVWYIEQMNVVEAFLLNPLTFAVNGVLDFEKQRAALTTWEMARLFVEQMLASTEPEARAQGALAVPEKLAKLILKNGHTGALLSADTE